VVEFVFFFYHYLCLTSLKLLSVKGSFISKLNNGKKKLIM
jgi:hypothetical protein